MPALRIAVLKNVPGENPGRFLTAVRTVQVFLFAFLCRDGC